jgi:hypothetical protein
MCDGVSDACVEYWVARHDRDDWLCVDTEDDTLTPELARKVSQQLLALCDWAESDAGRAVLARERADNCTIQID